MFQADYELRAPPQGFNSVKGLGQTEPNPLMTEEFEDGLTLASGHGVPLSVTKELNKKVTLLHNEYPLK